jgi:hypothetical protein
MRKLRQILIGMFTLGTVWPRADRPCRRRKIADDPLKNGIKDARQVEVAMSEKDIVNEPEP